MLRGFFLSLVAPRRRLRQVIARGLPGRHRQRRVRWLVRCYKCPNGWPRQEHDVGDPRTGVPTLVITPASLQSPWQRVAERHGIACVAVFVALLLVQLPLILNPGYFSHDELEWWARATTSGWLQLPWAAWTDISVFQYRPLTFNLWLIFAHVLAATPYAMHLLVVCLGCANALLLVACVEAAGASWLNAIAAAIAFVLTPYVAYTHGWVGTLADLLTLGAGLLALRCLQRLGLPRRRHDGWRTGAAVVALTLVALLSKESAVVLPAFLLTALYRHPRRRVVCAIVAASALVVAIYLGLRLGVILHAPRTGAGYTWSAANIPSRLAGYLLFPFTPPLFEVGPTLTKSLPRLLAAAACLGALTVSLASAGWRWPVAWLALIVVLLGPVLILDASYNQYAYLASAAGVGLVAVPWSLMPRRARIAILVVAAVSSVHGVAIMSRMHQVGVTQRNFYADLLGHLAAGGQTLPICVSHDSDRWLLSRFLTGVPSYRGMAIGARVRIVDSAGQSDVPDLLLMKSDGHLVAAAKR